jgi:hypothetical protein
MRGFKSFITENEIRPVEHYSLDNAPRVAEDQRRLDHNQIKDYTQDPHEVYVMQIGFKTLNHLPDSHKTYKKYGPQKYAKTELQHINLDPDKLHFSQQSVNVEKVKHFMKHYDSDPKKMHKYDELRNWEAPQVHVYPDGNMTTGDHHRLIALMLRGDKSTIARVTTWGHNHKNGGYQQLKPRKDTSIIQD